MITVLTMSIFKDVPSEKREQPHHVLEGLKNPPVF